MQVGPFQLEFWHFLVIGLGAVGLLWVVAGFLVKVTGTWERVDEDVKPGNVERITLVQFGPFVRGRRMMKGGFQEYSGVLRGRHLFLTRRDHGRAMIIAQGFPDAVADEIDGSVTAKLRLNLSADGQVIHGTFSPQKIEFTYQPPKVTSRRFLDPSFRRYKLLSRTPVETEVVDAEQSQDRPSSDRKAPVRRTV